MKRFVTLLLLALMRLILSVRYKIKTEGLDKINANTFHKPGGILFLPNHPTIFVDPTVAVLAIWKKFPIRPLIVEYMYYLPVVNWVMRFLNALPIPNFVSASNSLKKKKADLVFEKVIDGLKKGENFLIYPAGKVKHQAKESVNGSGIHRVIESYPEVNIVLVRIKGLWGSSFSRAITGQTPYMFATIFQGMKQAFKSLIFFLPKREITLEFLPAPADFPYQGTRLQINQYLEKWYNRPDGLSEKLEKEPEDKEPGETLNLVSYSVWKNELPKITTAKKRVGSVDLSTIPAFVQEKIKEKLAEMTQMKIEQIQPEMSLGGDLGLDSLDGAELIAFLDDQFEVSSVPVSELTHVDRLMAIAAKTIKVQEAKEEVLINSSAWHADSFKRKPPLFAGKTLPEVFLNTCQRMKSAPACGDARAGILTYAQAKLRVLLLAEYIQTLPGTYIGILLPSSVAAYLCVLACQLAGKVPLMVNWTVGSRHFESIAAASKVETVLSSWAFIDRLENVNFQGIEEKIVMLEDVAMQRFSLWTKVRAFFRSKRSTKKILELFGANQQSENDQAVLLFTSGTESAPKGVPLTHQNILSNQKACLQEVNPRPEDIMLGILPPFHSFGFTLSGLLPLVAGFRAAYFPDPTDGKGIAQAIEQWQATMVCGAPSFLKAIFKNAKMGQLNSVRLCFTGAEKPSSDLIEMVKKLEQCLLGEGYGITECSPVLTLNLSGNPKAGVGKVIPGSELCIVKLQDHEPVEQGEEGLILGPNIFSGYLDPANASPFVKVKGEEWYNTGDLGYLDKEGNLILSGRLKRFIKIAGEMVSLAAIEHTLSHALHEKEMEGQSHSPSLAVCAKEEAGEKPKIIVFTRHLSSKEEFNRFLKEAGFSNLTKIYKVVKVEEIPLMGTGKINYRALESTFETVLSSEGKEQTINAPGQRI